MQFISYSGFCQSFSPFFNVHKSPTNCLIIPVTKVLGVILRIFEAWLRCLKRAVTHTIFFKWSKIKEIYSMDNRKKRNYLDVVRAGYQALSKAGKSKKLDEMCSILGWNRKSILRLLNNQPQKTKGSGRPKKYSLEAIKHLCKLWKGMEQMCSRKMVVALHTWLPYYKECSESVKQEILSMSASTIDRYLRPYRVVGKELCDQVQDRVP